MPAEDSPQLSDVTYDELVVGQRFPPTVETVDRALADGVRGEIGVPEPGPSAPPAAFPVLFLRALRHAMGGIPPGSILGKQDLEFHAPVPVDGSVTIETWVGEKYVRRGRPYAVIDFEVRRADDEVAVTGRKVIIWPRLPGEDGA